MHYYGKSRTTIAYLHFSAIQIQHGIIFAFGGWCCHYIQLALLCSTTFYDQKWLASSRLIMVDEQKRKSFPLWLISISLSVCNLINFLIIQPLKMCISIIMWNCNRFFATTFSVYTRHLILHMYFYMSRGKQSNRLILQAEEYCPVCLVEQVQRKHSEPFSKFKSNLFHIISVEWVPFWRLATNACIRQLLSVLLTIWMLSEMLYLLYTDVFALLFVHEVGFFSWGWRWICAVARTVMMAVTAESAVKRKSHDSSWLQVNSVRCPSFVWWNSWNYIESLPPNNACIHMSPVSISKHPPQLWLRYLQLLEAISRQTQDWQEKWLHMQQRRVMCRRKFVA